MVALIVAFPARRAVTRPVGSTDATEPSLLVHVMAGVVVPTGVTVKVSVSPARNTVVVAVTWSVPVGAVGVDVDSHASWTMSMAQTASPCARRRHTNVNEDDTPATVAR